MGSEQGFCVTTLRALGVLKQEEWVIIFTNRGRHSRCDSVGLKAAKKLCGELSTSRFDMVHFENVRHLYNQQKLVCLDRECSFTLIQYHIWI